MRYLPFALAALFLASPALAEDATARPAAAIAPAAATAPASVVAPGTAAAPAAADVATPAEAAPPPPSWVYMVVRVKLADNDITQVAFLRHPAITTLEACEQERAAGMMQGWRYYNRYYFKTLKGTSYKIDFRCVAGEQFLAGWRPGDLLNRYYLVRTTDGKLDARPQESFFACRHALRKATAEEGIDTFCGVTSQAIAQPTAEELEAATAAAAAAAAAAAEAAAEAPASPAGTPVPATPATPVPATPAR